MIESYFNDTVTIRSVTVNEWRVRSVSDTVVSCRVEYGERMLTDYSGKQVLSPMRVYLSPDVVVGGEDSVVYSGVEHRIVSVQVMSDFQDQYLLVNLL